MTARPTRRPLRAPARALAVVALACVGLTACQQGADAPGTSAPTSTGAKGSSAPSTPRTSPTADADAPLPWGPTQGELDAARAQVADWPAERLAGQVIVGRYAGTDPAIPAAMVRDLHLAGVCVTSGNVVDAAQVRATTAAVARAVAADGREFPGVIGVDQEGGSVEHLRGIATVFPPFAYAGAAVAADPAAGGRIVTDAARTTGLELRDFGFTWAFAPVADVTIGDADVTIGTRSPSSDPKVAAAAVRAAVTGFNDAGIVSTTKHFPGHGQVTANSHDVLPVLDVPLAEIRQHDLPPFEAAVAAHAPSVMMAHVKVPAISPDHAGSLDPAMYALLRDDLGFGGVTITDSLGMGGALAEPFPAIKALNAGADLLLMPVDTATTHRLVTEAIEKGTISRARAEDAAARVIALQTWQARVAAATPVPADITTRAQRAAAALTAGP